MYHVAGVDVGSGTTKVVIMGEGRRVLGVSELRSGADLEAAAVEGLEKACRVARVDHARIAYVAATGYGRYQVGFRDVQITEITCHARGAHYLFPGTRCVLDVGAQCTRAINVDFHGRVRKFRSNDKCAAGAGRFLERVAKALEVDLEQLGELSLRSKEPQPISSVCAVLAESEVINHVSQERKTEDILNGVHRSIVDRLAALLRQVGLESEVTLTGGVARNIGIVRLLEARLERQVNVSSDAPLAGALGAAVLALERMRKLGAEGTHLYVREGQA
ncbi:MAG: 2-hydroxyglutaryl-CoA dehydratase [Planctomycetes bacterium]|nr:2-hydroxyglutaryl-CoA dehydratase [Planctomycetota bacterium]